MKLHRIAVTNLNSLYGEQTVDLDRDLEGAGLFLIQGPTGAGKSTLMDAVSLALFGVTPRLTGAKGQPPVGEQLMSRGAGMARAELEFSKHEPAVGRRVRYRAVWLARRARGKPDGKLQKAERSLERLDHDGDWIKLTSDSRAKVYGPVFDAVLERFTAEDFARSMLLAQGHFDKMLHAKPEERAQILERLTDTAIYQTLGKRAAAMGAAWRGKLQLLEARATAIARLTPEQITTLEAIVQQKVVVLERLDSALSDVRSQRDWLRRDLALHSDQARAAAGRADASQAEEKAKDAMIALAAHQRCAQAFGAYDRRFDEAQQLAENTARRRDVAARVPGLQATERDSSAALALTVAQRNQAESDLNALRPAVQRATESTAALTLAESEHAAAKTKLQGETIRVNGPGGAVAALHLQTRQAEDAKQAVQRAAQAWHAVRSDAPLVAALPEVTSRAAAVVELSRSVEGRAADVLRRRDGLTKSRKRLTVDQAAHIATQQTTLAPLRRAVQETKAALFTVVGVSPPAEPSADGVASTAGDVRVVAEAVAALSAQRKTLLARHELARTAQQAVEMQAESAESVTQQRAGLVLADARVTQAKTAMEAAGRMLADKVAVLVASEEVLRPLERIAALAEQRDALAANEACPLCGGVDHPFVHDPARRAQADAIDREVAAARAERERCLRVREGATATVDDAKSRHAGQIGEQRALRSALVNAEAALVEATAQAAASLSRAGLPSTTTVVEVVARLEAITQEGKAVAARRDALDAAAAANRGAQGALRDASAGLVSAAEDLARRAAQQEQAESELATRQIDLAQTRQELVDRCAALTATLADLRVDVGGDTPQALAIAVEAARVRVETFELRKRAQADAIAALDTAEAARSASAVALKQARERLRDTGADVATREKAEAVASAQAVEVRAVLQALWQRIAAADPGQPRPDAVEPPDVLLDSQVVHVQGLAGAVQQRITEQQRAALAATTAKTQLATLEEQGAQLQERLDAANLALQAALASADTPDIETLLACRLSVEQVHTLEQRRDALLRARREAEAAVTAAQQLRDRHLAERPETLSAEASVASLEGEVTRLTEEREIGSATLDGPEGSRTQLQIARRDAASHSAADAALKDARVAGRVWLRLHDLIGVKDGGRFKAFAQALNLDQLLMQANRHLVHLNDRYRLRTVKEPETGLPTLVFQVEDRWRPGTMRSLKTLSGGESFLVSLALALGLSDLRTSSMPVETLLLDEGFGTLDRETLEMALAALQRLQESGRQVGIISHVQGLQESIPARIEVQPIGEGRSRVIVGQR